MEKIEMTRPFMGLLYMQVCVEGKITDEEILEYCNRVNPSGTTNGWGLVFRNSKDDDKNPKPCKDHPTRTHYLIAC